MRAAIWAMSQGYQMSVNDDIADRTIMHAVRLERLKTTKSKDFAKALNELLFPDLEAAVGKVSRNGLTIQGRRASRKLINSIAKQ